MLDEKIRELYKSIWTTGIKANLEDEKLLSSNPTLSYSYAKNILKSRFELGEKIIATNAAYSYWYAFYVLKGRFQLGEESISRHARCAYLYAYDILHSRFELGEDEISNYSHYCFPYINNIFNGLIPLDFLELCSIDILESILNNKKYEMFLSLSLADLHDLYNLDKFSMEINNIRNKDDVIRVLFKKKLL